MANEYSTLALLKSTLTIADTDRDLLLNAALAAASRSIDNHCGRRFYLDAAASARIYRAEGRVTGPLFIVDDIGAAAGIVAEIGSAAAGWTVVTSEVEHSPENASARAVAITGLNRDGGWHIASDQRVRVSARWGWPAVPDEVAQASLILAARLYRRKDSPEGVIGSSEWGTVRLSRTDPDVAALVARYVLLGFA